MTSRHIYRQKSVPFLLELNHSLLPHGGLGIFQLPTDRDDWEHPAKGQQLTIASDCGPEIWCAVNWLDTHGHMHVTRIADTNHCAHNDILLTMFDCRLGPCMYLLMLCINIGFLPWGDGRFGRMVSGSMEDISTVVDEHVPLFQAYLPDIALDKGMPDELGTQNGEGRICFCNGSF